MNGVLLIIILNKKMMKWYNNQYIYFEAPERGGHCGFASIDKEYYWSELRAVEFMAMIKFVNTQSY